MSRRSSSRWCRPRRKEPRGSCCTAIEKRSVQDNPYWRACTDDELQFQVQGQSSPKEIRLERLQSGLATATTRIMFQVEFVGFSRLGSSVVQPLRQNIPRYELLRDPAIPAPSRFSNYD